MEGYEAPDEVWYAKEKADWEAAREIEKGGGVGGSGGTKMLEEGDVQGQLEQEAQQAKGGRKGIFSNSTLAALKGYTATPANKRPAPVTGPLVGYGSDDDSD